jgi:Fic family protein
MAVTYHEGMFPPQSLDWERIAPYLANAMAELARYDSFLGLMPYKDILLSPMLTAEATHSSRMEGTRATVSDVLAYEAGVTHVSVEKQNDIQEIINYRSAVHTAEELMTNLPLTGRVLCAAHSVLLKGVRGELKSPGRYRCDQVWIGPNNNIADARYIPPHADAVPSAMARWERFVNDDQATPLVTIAIAHAEFEAVHPFMDGNGRMGRIAIPLMLNMYGIISSPCFYLSDFFEHRNTEYQDRLLAVSETDSWTDWCVFFLDAVYVQARENNAKANGIYSLYNEILSFLLDTVRSDNAHKVVPYLFGKPLFPSTIFTKEAGLSSGTAKRLISALKDSGRIVEVQPHRGNMPAVFAIPELLRIVEGVDID